MADSASSYRGGRGGRRGGYRAHPYGKDAPADTSKANDDRGDRHRDRDRERDRERDRTDRPKHERNDRYRSDDRVSKSRASGPPAKPGLGHASRPSRASAEREIPTGPREANARFRMPTADLKPRESASTKALEAELKEMTEDEKIARLMGFSKFRTTKNTKIPGNEFNYAVRKEKETKYRQYMNRQGGFNRPLSPSR